MNTPASEPLSPLPPASGQQVAKDPVTMSIWVLNQLLSLDCVSVTRQFSKLESSDPAYCIHVRPYQPSTIRSDLLKIIVDTSNLYGGDGRADVKALAQSISNFLQQAGLNKMQASSPISNMIRVQAKDNAAIKTLLDLYVNVTQSRPKAKNSSVITGKPNTTHTNSSETPLRNILGDYFKNLAIRSPLRRPRSDWPREDKGWELPGK